MACLIYTIASIFLVVSITGIPICSYILSEYLNLKTYYPTNCTGTLNYTYDNNIIGYYQCSVRSQSFGQEVILSNPPFNYHFEMVSLSDCNKWHDAMQNGSFACYLSTNHDAVLDGYTVLDSITGWAIGLSIGCLLFIISMLLFFFQCSRNTRTPLF